MTRAKSHPLAVGAALAGVLALVPAMADAKAVPGAPWVEAADESIVKAFDPLEPGLAARPATLLETDYYVYGPGTGFDEVVLTLTLDDRGFTQAVSYWLYWENRETNDRRYYSLRTGGFSNTERDLFGTPGDPSAVIASDLDGFLVFGPGDSAFGPVPGTIPVTTGRYQFVFEVRNAAGNQVLSRGNAMYSWVDGVVAKNGNVAANETWTKNNAYFLAAPVNVQAGATLTIEEGTVILGSNANQGTLVVRQGARIEAEGDAMNPIVFTSERPVGSRTAGDWGGLVINGNAPTNQTNPQGEGDSGPYGGANANDDSGTLAYVRVEFAGIRFSDQNELNGIALQGVGAGTDIHHVQVHFNQDDGIEFFGGTANAKFVLITDAFDDSLDWTFGWTGKLQHFVAIQRFGGSNRLIEADNFEDGHDALPRSNPMIANATFIGNGPIQGVPNLPVTADELDELRLRRGTAGNLTHLVAEGANAQLVNVTDAASQNLLGTDLQIRNSVLFTAGTLADEPALAYLQAPAQGNLFTAPGIFNPRSLIMPDVAANSTPNRQLPVEFRNDPFFDNVNFIGGVNPNNPWIYEGWTTFSDN